MVYFKYSVSGLPFENKMDGKPLVLVAEAHCTVRELFACVSSHAECDVSLLYDMLIGGKLHTQRITADPLTPTLLETPLSYLFFSDYKPSVAVVLHADGDTGNIPPERTWRGWQ